MRISTKGEYGIRALIELTNRYGEARPIQSSEIASRQKIPESYLEQLLTTAKRASGAHERATGLPNDDLIAFIEEAQAKAGCA